MRTPSMTASRVAEGFEPFLVELDGFQGPLDLLLHLIRSQDVDIFDIPIAAPGFRLPRPSPSSPHFASGCERPCCAACGGGSGEVVSWLT